LLKTALIELFGIEHPVIQGGMTYLGNAELVAAVSNAGGLGVLGTGNAPPEWVREQIALVQMLTDRPFGINILLTSPFVKEVVKVVIAARVPIVATGGGNPSPYIPELRVAGLKVMPVVSSVVLAKHLESLGVNALVAEGMESGGHIGELTTMALVPQVVDSVRIPVVAAGGIADGRGLVAALALGAQGVQIGTRFICAEECIAHPKFKQRLLRANSCATTVIGQFIGHSVRCLQNRMTQEFLAMEKGGASKEELEHFSQGKFYSGVIEGDTDNGLLMAGQDAGLIKEIKPAKEIIEQMVAEAEAIIARLGVYSIRGGYQ